MKLSDNIQALLEEHANQALPIGKLLQYTGEQGFGLLTGLLTIPMLIPLPIPLPGFSTLFGAGLMLLGLQVARGADRPWLPTRIAQLELSPANSQRLLQGLTRLLRPIERLARTRLPQVTQNWLLHRLLGVCMAWNALLLALPLPIPLTNLLPAYTILIFTIGLLEADGLFFLMGYAMTTTTTLFFVSISQAIWSLVRHLWGQ
jgi:hypothetical protein